MYFIILELNCNIELEIVLFCTILNSVLTHNQAEL